MKTILLFFFCTSLIYSQGMYLSRENGLSLGFIYEGNRDLSKLRFSASYSLLGFVDFSYARSTFLSEENSSNFQNEYFIRAYLLKGKIPIFFSGSLGYLYSKSETELWNNFPLNATTKGFTYGVGLHIQAAKEQKPLKLVVSFIYSFFNSEQIIRTSAATVSDSKLIRSLIFEAAIVYYFSHVGIIIGPRFSFENDFENNLYGLNLTFMFRHF